MELLLSEALLDLCIELYEEFLLLGVRLNTAQTRSIASDCIRILCPNEIFREIKNEISIIRFCIRAIPF